MSTKKQLFVDAQVLQTTARDRGMGRYCICLLRALLDTNEYDITMILTSELKMSTEHDAELKEALDGAKFEVLELATVGKRTIEEASRANRTLLTRYIESNAREGATFFIPSLFQEPLASVFPDYPVVKALLFHDLIPYLYHLRYERVMQWQNYLKRFRTIFEADVVLTNSQTVADDLAIYLGVPKSKLHRIDGAAIHIDKTLEKPDHVDLSKPFILFNTSDDPRKNNLRSILAFEEFRRTTGLDYTMILTSYFSKRDREQLERFSKHIQFAGSIPERQLNWLFRDCEFVLFTPESEGLGLPALEAVDAGKKAVCSSINVLREISTDAFFYCDYENSYSIAQAMRQTVEPKAVVNKEAYKAIRAYYSWPQTAKRMVAGLAKTKPAKQQAKPKIAIVMATPSGLSGVGLTGAILHPTLADYFDIEYYLERGLSNVSVRPNYLQYVTACYPASAFSARRYAQYDAVFYHIGNGDYHLESITAGFNLPGYLLMHDTTLVEAFRVMREVGLMDESRVKLESRLDEVGGIKHSSHYSSLANRQLGLIAHSDYAATAAKEVLYEAVPVVKANLPTFIPEIQNTRAGDKIVIGLAGAIADVKGLDIIETIANDPQFSDCDIRLFGFNHAPAETIARLDAYENVSVATNVTDFDFQTSFAKLDIFVNYRLIYKGETSNTTLEAMRQGVVAIVRKVGWYDELQDDVVVKVESPEAVLGSLRELVADKKKLRTIGAKAKAYVTEHFSAEQYAQAMLDMLAKDQSNNPNAATAAALKAGKIKNATSLIAFLKKKGAV